MPVKALVLDADGTAALLVGIRERARELARPCVVALDGRSGVGKSTLAANIAQTLGACVLGGDDFFAGGVTVRSDAPQDRVRDCIDWQRQRPVLEALRAGREASYVAFDWDAFDGRLDTAPTVVEPRPVVLFEGVYTARPELTDLVDLRLVLCLDEATRVARARGQHQRLGAAMARSGGMVLLALGSAPSLRHGLERATESGLSGPLLPAIDSDDRTRSPLSLRTTKAMSQ